MIACGSRPARQDFRERSIVCHLLLIGLPLAALSVFWFLPLPIALPTFLLIGGATAAFYWYLYKGNNGPVVSQRFSEENALDRRHWRL